MAASTVKSSPINLQYRLRQCTRNGSYPPQMHLLKAGRYPAYYDPSDSGAASVWKRCTNLSRCPKAF